MGVTPPWRKERTAHFPGLPAWSMPAEAYHGESFPLKLFPGIDPEWAWSGATGEGIRVCILDSGVDGSHPGVAPVDASWQVATDNEGDVVIEQCKPRDAVGHGTACAGIVRSIAPLVSLSSVRVLTDGKTGSGAALIAGLRHAIEEGFDVVNLSLSTPRQEFRPHLAELADLAQFRRCILVVSAHNLPIQSYPWNFASVLSVASHDEDDPMRFYYNARPPVDFHARGVRVPVAKPGGGEIRNTGNSFAAPHITGIAALILSKHPWLTPFQLKSVLFHCSANVRAIQEGVNVDAG